MKSEGQQLYEVRPAVNRDSDFFHDNLAHSISALLNTHSMKSGEGFHYHIFLFSVNIHSWQLPKIINNNSNHILLGT